MPITRKVVPLDVPGKFIIAENSQRVNSISVTKISPLAEFAFDFGNSQSTSTIDRRCVVRIPKAGARTDKEEGVALLNESAQAGLSVWLTISYQRAGDPPNEGIEIVCAS